MVSEQNLTVPVLAQKSYRWALAAVLIIYFLIYGWILITSDYIPYVMDGNESYSSLTHASNLYSFGIDKSIGLTDEATSPDPGAHPFIHTHQGNFPRIYAYLIYLLGARSIESQIVVTAFTTGLASIYFAFVFFTRISTPLNALIYCLVLMTDYVLFAQWHTVTYRSWHCFFFFSSLLCAQGFASPKRKTWMVLTLFNFIGLFYWELVFATFVATTTGLYTGWIYRRNLKTIILAWSTQLAGALCGLGILILQLVSYLGWKDFLLDIKYTFSARNFAQDNQAWIDEILNFYQSRNVLFLHNFQAAEKFEGFQTFLANLFTYSFQIHTPLLTFIILLIFFGWLMGTGIHTFNKYGLSRTTVPRQEEMGTPYFFSATALFATSWYLFVFFLYRKSDVFTGLNQSSLPSSAAAWLTGMLLILPVVLFLTFLCVRLLQTTQSDHEPSALSKILTATVYLLAAVLLMTVQNRLYNQQLRIIWENMALFSSPMPTLLVVFLAAVIGVSLIFLGPRKLFGNKESNLTGVIPFLIAGLLAFGFVYKLSPGYVSSGYLVRYAPFIVFHVDTIIAISLCLLLLLTQRTYQWLRCFQDITNFSPARLMVRQSMILGVGSVTLLCFSLIYWTNLQANYIQLFPYDHFTFLKKLKAPPYKGASFITNNYGPLIYGHTDQWAYIANYLGEKSIQLTAEGYDLDIKREDLWVADRYVRQDYSKPEYFLCFTIHNIYQAIERLSPPTSSRNHCSNSYLVKFASSNISKIFQHKIMERDTSRFDAWAIVKLDWEFPPFLKLSDPANLDTAVKFSISGSPEHMTARIDYEYTHQDGIPEGDTIVRLYTLDPNNSSRSKERGDGEKRLLKEGIKSRIFHLPPHIHGCFKAAVIPKSINKQAFEYTSPPICLPAYDS